MFSQSIYGEPIYVVTSPDLLVGGGVLLLCALGLLAMFAPRRVRG